MLFFYFIFFYFNEVFIFTQFFKSIMCYFLFLFNRDMMVNLYKLYFQLNKKVFYLLIFPPSQPNTIEGT